MKPSPTCPNCGGSKLYASDEVGAGGGHAPNYLPGLERYWGFVSAKFRVIVCTGCGLTRFFAGDDATGRIPESDHWRKL